MTKPTFQQLADQLHTELEALFKRWPELHPDSRNAIIIQTPMSRQEIARLIHAAELALEPFLDIPFRDRMVIGQND